MLIETASRDTTETLLIPAADASAAAGRPGTKKGQASNTAPITPTGRTAASSTWSPTTGRRSSGWSGCRRRAPGRAALDRGHRRVAGHPPGVGRRVRAVPGGGAAARRRDPVARRGPPHRVSSGSSRPVARRSRSPWRSTRTTRAAAVTVRTESLIDPPAWHDVDLASGRWELRKRQEVPGYDPAGYVTERITAPAPDGTQVPVTIAYRRGPRPDGTAPCLLYGYGAYEVVHLAGVQRGDAEPAGPGFRVRGGARPGRRGGRPRLVAERAAGPQAQHVHRLHRRRRHAGATGAGRHRTGSSRAGCPRAACCRARCSRWRRGAGGRWWPRSRSWTA